MVDSPTTLTDHFEHLYGQDPSTRDAVHEHAGISAGEIMRLQMAKLVLPGWHKRSVRKMVTGYAEHIHAQMRDLEELAALEAELSKTENQLQETESRATEEEARLTEVQEKHEAVAALLEADKEQLENHAQESIAAFEAQTKQRIETVVEATDPTVQSRRLIENQLLQSDLLQKDDDGNIDFNEAAIVNRLEELFLSEFIKGIEDREGRGSWLDRQVNSLAGSRSPRLDRIRSVAEMKHVDWVASTKYAQSRGLPMPCYPFLLTRQADDDVEKQSGTVNTAICIDTSPSMRDNQRFSVARKLALALNALMRRINPGRRVRLGHFNFQAHSTTASELFRMVTLRNNTNTHLALDWLHDNLVDARPAIAYLITDGAPSSRNHQLVKAAAKFTQYDDLHLRIVLVDGDARAKNIIRRIGEAAGSETKVITVKTDELAGEVIVDVVNTIEGIYSIADF
jgi:hypothetical protein